MGWVTAAGFGRGRTHREFAMPPGKIPRVRPEEAFQRPYPNLRRMDAYSRLGVTAVALALKDAGLATWSRKRRIGIVAATIHGCLGADVDYYRTALPDAGAQASPAVFSYTSANSFLGAAAVHFGLTGITYAVSQDSATNLAGLASALLHFATYGGDGILGGFCDAGCPNIFRQAYPTPPAAVFFMLQKAGSGAQPSLGSLSLSSSGSLLLNGNPVDLLTTLVKLCLQNRMPRF